MFRHLRGEFIAGHDGEADPVPGHGIQDVVASLEHLVDQVAGLEERVVRDLFRGDDRKGSKAEDLFVKGLELQPAAQLVGDLLDIELELAHGCAFFYPGMGAVETFLDIRIPIAVRIFRGVAVGPRPEPVGSLPIGTHAVTVGIPAHPGAPFLVLFVPVAGFELRPPADLRLRIDKPTLPGANLLDDSRVHRVANRLAGSGLVEHPAVGGPCIVCRHRRHWKGRLPPVLLFQPPDGAPGVILSAFFAFHQVAGGMHLGGLCR